MRQTNNVIANDGYTKSDIQKFHCDIAGVYRHPSKQLYMKYSFA